MKLIFAAAASAGLLAGSGAALAGPNPMTIITNPDWLVKPSGESIARHYPGVPAVLHLSGYATISCKVTPAGALADCAVVSEGPKDLGFGKAALDMSVEFRMRPPTRNGQPVDGGTVRIPIRFELPKAEPPPPQPAAQSDEALKQALRIVDAYGMVDRTVALYASGGPVFWRSADTAPTASRAAALKALGDAALIRRNEFRDAAGRIYAAMFSAEQLRTIADYQESNGKTLQANGKLAGATMAAIMEASVAGESAAHDLYCGRHPCVSATEIQRVWRPVARGAPRLDEPLWIKTPDEWKLKSAAPKLSQELGLTGVVSLSCDVKTTGELDACSVADEAPAGLGHAAAALSLAKEYQLSPLQTPVGNSKLQVVVRIGFTPRAQMRFPSPGRTETIKPPVAASEGALSLARRTMADDKMAEALQAISSRDMLGAADVAPVGADLSLYAAQKEALKAGFEQVAASLPETLARLLAAALTEDQLAATLAFRESSAGKAQREKQAAVSKAMAEAWTHVDFEIAEDARQVYCKTHDCQAPLPARAAGRAPVSQPTSEKPASPTAKP
jgi:TonB family protein